MFHEDGFRPNDQRGFLHKSFIGKAIGGAFKGFVKGGPLGALGGVAGSFSKRPARNVLPRELTGRSTGEEGKALGRTLKFGNGGDTPVSRAAPEQDGCRFPARRDPRTGLCKIFLGEESGRDRPKAERDAEKRERTLAAVGDAVMGQFGAALEPAFMTVERSVCLSGMQLARDGLCYNKGSISNSQRMWPRGRRPLLTGGDMRAIAIAARAGATLDRTTKRLRNLGMMKRLPTPRKAAPHQHAKALPAVSIT